MKRKLLCLALAVAFCLASAVPAYGAAVSTYSVSVSQGQVSFLRGGYVTGTFRIQGSDVTAMTGENGDLLICFTDTKGSFVGVTLGKQEIVNFYGTIGTLLLDSSLDRPVVVGASARVSDLVVNAPVKVSIWGRVDSGRVSDAANLVAAKGSVVKDVTLEDDSARLFANQGSVVDGTTYDGDYDDDDDDYDDGRVTSGGITLYTDTIYAAYGDTLRELRYDLEDNVRAYNRDDERVYGDVEWSSSLNTEVLRDRTFSFRFIPEQSRYKTVSGTIRVVVDDDDDDDDDWRREDLELEIETITTSSSTKRLSSYLEKLEARVKAYNEDGRRVYGEVKWARPSTRVRETDYYEFIFMPYGTRYNNVRDEIEIVVDDD